MEMSRLDSLCQNLPDDTIESLVASMLKAAASQAPMREEAARRRAAEEKAESENTLENLRSQQRQAEPRKVADDPINSKGELRLR